MKLIWGKVGNSQVFVLLPRAELTDEEKTMGKGAVLIDLSRRHDGGCIFSLDNLAAHDSHAPRWNAVDGSSVSSTPGNAEEYKTRVQKEIESQGVTVTEVEEQKVALISTPAYGPASEATPPTGEGWKKYGVDSEEEVN